jgi:hypothetical protein
MIMSQDKRIVRITCSSKQLPSKSVNIETRASFNGMATGGCVHSAVTVPLCLRRHGGRTQYNFFNILRSILLLAVVYVTIFLLRSILLTGSINKYSGVLMRRTVHCTHNPENPKRNMTGKRRGHFSFFITHCCSPP